MKEQTFNGAVFGGVAGRDLVNNIHLTRGLTESELQASFFRNTGIDCNRLARGQMETLLERHHFTVLELQRAWRASSLTWNAAEKRLIATSRRIDIFVGWAGMIGLSTFFVLSAFFVYSTDIAYWIKMTSSGLGMVMFLGLARALLLTTIWPQMVARRAEKAIQEEMTG